MLIVSLSYPAPQTFSRLCDGVSRPLRPVPLYGSTGVGDVTPLAHIVEDLIFLKPPQRVKDAHEAVENDIDNDEYATMPTALLAAGEALPLIAQVRWCSMALVS